MLNDDKEIKSNEDIQKVKILISNMKLISDTGLKGYQPYTEKEGVYKILQIVPCYRKIDAVINDGTKEPVVVFALISEITKDGENLYTVPFTMDGKGKMYDEDIRKNGNIIEYIFS